VKAIVQAAVAGGDDDAGMGRVLVLAEIAAELQAVAMRLEEITQDELGRTFEENLQARRAIPGFENGPVPFLQPGDHGTAKVAIIVYDQAGIHDCLNTEYPRFLKKDKPAIT
jgi:hypothetical protein